MNSIGFKSGEYGGKKIIERTCTVEDNAGNMASCAQTITVQDTTAPAFNSVLESTATYACDEELPDGYEVKATDNCGEATVIVTDTTPVYSETCPNAYTFTRTWNAVDECGNAAQPASQVISVVDTVAPVIECPPNVDASSLGEVPAPSPADVDAHDNCGRSVSVKWSEDSDNGGSGCLDDPRIITRTYKATDDCGNTASCTQIITLKIEPPACDITGPDEVYPHSNDNTASVEPVAGASYFWTIENGVLNSGQGTPSITWTAGDIGVAIIHVTVTAPESEGGCSSTCLYEVSVVNQPPVAVDDTYSTNEDATLTVPEPGVIENDEDPDKDIVTVTDYPQPSSGTVTVNTDGSFAYTPYENYCGPESFTYTISDTRGLTDTANVDIDVVCVNDPPVAADDFGTTDENVALEGIDVITNDDDPDEGDVLTVTSVTKPDHGIAEIKDNAINYKPDLWYSEDDSFQYTITDTTGLTATATVTITIEDGIPSAEDICAYIQELPDDAFDKDASNQKKTFCNKLAAVGKQIANKDYRGAIDKLENDIRSKADGSLVGNPKNDWITDPDGQAELCSMIDILLGALNAL